MYWSCVDVESESLKLSIIVPIYNAGLFLDRCIDSIVRQTYQNLEIILVNDGSEDNSLDICKKYQNLDCRIEIIDKRNEGVSAARKDGLKISTGDFITFVDADDYIDDNMYKSLMMAIIEGEYDIIESGYILVNEKEEIINKRLLREEQNIGVNQCLEAYLSNKNSDTFLWNKLYRKELFDGFDFPEFRYSEDYLWNVMLYSKCKKSVTVNKAYYYYYKNMSGACNNNCYRAKIDGVLAGIKALEFLNYYFPKISYYGLMYIIDYIRFLYMAQYELQVKDRDFYKELSNYYRKYFNIETIIKIKRKGKIPGYLLFYVLPGFYAFFNKLYHKIKS